MTPRTTSQPPQEQQRQQRPADHCPTSGGIRPNNYTRTIRGVGLASVAQVGKKTPWSWLGKSRGTERESETEKDMYRNTYTDIHECM